MAVRIDGRTLNRYGLTPGEFTLYLTLLTLAASDGRFTLPRQLPCNLSSRSVQRHLGTLERAGFISRNPWRINPPTAWVDRACLEQCRKPAPKPPAPYDGNTYGEWRNAQDHPALLDFLTRANPTYDESIAYLRTRDRSNNKRANEWWSKPESRAHLINAVLRRGARRIEQVEREALLPKGKLYYYLKSFDLSFKMRPDKRAFVIFYDGTLHEAYLVREYSNLRALLEIQHPTHVERHYGRWSPASWAYRLYHQQGTAARTLPLYQAARHCRVSAQGMKAILRRIGFRNQPQAVPIYLVEKLSGKPWGLQDED